MSGNHWHFAPDSADCLAALAVELAVLCPHRIGAGSEELIVGAGSEGLLVGADTDGLTVGADPDASIVELFEELQVCIMHACISKTHIFLRLLESSLHYFEGLISLFIL